MSEHYSGGCQQCWDQAFIESRISPTSQPEAYERLLIENAEEHSRRPDRCKRCGAQLAADLDCWAYCPVCNWCPDCGITHAEQPDLRLKEPTCPTTPSA